MEKIRLNLGGLKVETFQSIPTAESRGTVEAREAYDTSSCDSNCNRSHCISGPCCGDNF
ncbi:MAG TPA: hypothetical protein VFQ39_11690 [Longimicrobium sp.]|nr:hypothetical protein [Longimicrobium sp.]